MALNILDNGDSARNIRDNINSNFATLDTGKANTNHASITTGNGAASTDVYGHVKITAGNGLTINDGLLSMSLASTTVAGAVQLVDNLTNTSTDKALTAAQGKTLKDTLNTLSQETPPKNHASAQTDYGLASSTMFGHIKVTPNNGLTLTDGVLTMKAASTSVIGAVQLEDTCTSNSSTRALTANMGKYLYDHRAETFSGTTTPSQNIGKDGDIYLLIA